MRELGDQRHTQGQEGRWNVLDGLAQFRHGHLLSIRPRIYGLGTTVHEKQKTLNSQETYAHI